MTGPKLNEKSYVVGERSGTKATARYVRSSAYKARAVLDLIRGLDVRSADEVLQFTERGIARDIRKVLASAVANAVNNDGQDADELFVVACFADEGPTLRRFRPRARGRATRIRKRTCHITVIVARMSDARLEILQARQERAGGTGRPSSASSRRARVARSRARAEAAATDAHRPRPTTCRSTPGRHRSTPRTPRRRRCVPVDAEPKRSTPPETLDERGRRGRRRQADAADTADDADEGTLDAGRVRRSVQPLADPKVAPEGYPIKGNTHSMLYHEPGTPLLRRNHRRGVVRHRRVGRGSRLLEAGCSATTTTRQRHGDEDGTS